MPSLGVDLVEIRKAKSFYRLHQKNLNSFFSAAEIRKIRASKKPHEELALLLAGKEAVFKAKDKQSMGFAGFASVSGSDRKIFHLSFVKTRDYVVAKCVGI